MNCRARQRRRAHQLEAELALVASVEGVDVLGPGVGPREGWTVEVTATGAVAGPALVRAVARHHGSIADVSPQGEHVRLTVEL